MFYPKTALASGEAAKWLLSRNTVNYLATLDRIRVDEMARTTGDWAEQKSPWSALYSIDLGNIKAVIIADLSAQVTPR
ncbi:MAG: hypothetical protein ACRYGP_32945 [Janthinobacterium lividum]